MRDLVQLRNDVIAPALRIDAEILSTTPTEFQSKNEIAYETLIGTWYYMWMDISPDLGEPFLQIISKKGLRFICLEAAAAATNLLTEDLDNHVWIDKDLELLVATLFDRIKRIDRPLLDQMKLMLQLLRFGKRFSPDCADKLIDSSYNAFFEVQRFVRDFRSSYSRPNFVWDVAKVVAGYLFDWHKIIKILRDWKDSGIKPLNFSSGASYTTGSRLSDKVMEVLMIDPDYLPNIGTHMVTTNSGELSPYPNIDMRGFRDNVRIVYNPVSYKINDYWGIPRCGMWKPPYVKRRAKLLSVPKTAKTRRMIAPEDALRQAYAVQAGHLLATVLPEFCNIHDQSRNQRLAKEGAISGFYDTIDLSAASDTVTSEHLELFPKAFRDIVEPLLPTHVTDPRNKKGIDHVLHSLATMGNGLTFPIVTMVCAVFAATSVVLTELFRCGIPATKPVIQRLVNEMRLKALISIYGDDIIINSAYTKLLLELLIRFGFKPNQDKSFTGVSRVCPIDMTVQQRFRESCGTDFLWLRDRCNVQYGDVSSVYWPRRVVSPGRYDSWTDTWIDTISATVSLHNGLKHHDDIWVKSVSFLKSVTLMLEPKMTETPDADCPDLDGTHTTMWVDPLEHVDRDKHSPPMLMCRLSYKVCTPTVVTDKAALKSYAPQGSEKLEMVTDLYERYKYYHFLMYGPTFDNELDRMLGISSKGLTFSSFVGCQKIHWRPISRYL